jgi:outer membrane receptor protein involved in Fe transport
VHVIPYRPAFESEDTESVRYLWVALDSADLQKALRGGLDIGNRDLVASLSAEYSVTGNRRTGAGRLPTRGYSSRAARAYIAATPSDGASWSLDLQWLEQPETPRVDEMIAGYGQSQPSASEFFFEPNARLFAHLQHDRVAGFLGLDWNIDLAWQRITDDRRTREFESPTRVLEANRSDLAGTRITAGTESGSLSWVIGAEAYRDDVSSRRTEIDLASGRSESVPPRFPDGSRVVQAAVFASAARPLSASHRVSAGLRFSAVDIDLPGGAGATSIESRRWSGDIGWVYEATSAWQVTANLGFGFRAPNIFDLGTLGSRPGNRFNIPNTALDAETVVHGDIGLRYASERSRLEIVAFALDYEDRITSVAIGEVTPDGRDIVQSVNAAASSIHGLELGLRTRITERIGLEATATYTRGEQRTVGEPSEPADRIPPLGGRLAITAGPYRHWTLRASIDWAGAQDRLSARDVQDTRIDPAGTPGWGELGASATWDRGGEWRLMLAAGNLLDKRYRRHGSGLDEPGRGLLASVRRQW